MSLSSVKILDRATPEAAQNISKLLMQLAPTLLPLTVEELQIVLWDTTLFVIYDDQMIVGITCLVTVFVPGGLTGFLESVVVDAAHRGQGIGEQLVNAALMLAKEKGVTRLDLTTGVRREAANRLYQRLGFEQRNSNVYRYTPSNGLTD